MAKLPVIYETDARKYHADRCEPLVNAVKEGKVRLHALARKGYPGTRLSRNNLPGVLSVGFWDASGSQNWGLDWHRNEGLELTFLETGSMPFALAQRKYLLKANDLTITRPWQPHCVGNPFIGPGRLHWLILDLQVRRPHQEWIWPKWLVINDNDLRKLTLLLRHNEKPVLRSGAEIKMCFRQIAQTLQSKDPDRRISRLTVFINELFINLLEMLEKRQLPLKPHLASSRRTVELFLDDLHLGRCSLSEDWTVEQMASQCGLGVTYFGKLCKQITNMTPNEYLNYCRIENAVILLKNSNNINITDIALQCGFSSSQYFATVFKTFKGASPRDFRNETSRENAVN